MVQVGSTEHISTTVMKQERWLLAGHSGRESRPREEGLQEALGGRRVT